MRYLCLLIGEPDTEGPAPGTPGFTQMLADYQSATQAMAAAGVLVDSGPQIKEQIGGYYVLDCAGADEAMRWAATIPAAKSGAIEIRPVMVLPANY